MEGIITTEDEEQRMSANRPKRLGEKSTSDQRLFKKLQRELMENRLPDQRMKKRQRYSKQILSDAQIVTERLNSKRLYLSKKRVNINLYLQLQWGNFCRYGCGFDHLKNASFGTLRCCFNNGKGLVENGGHPKISPLPLDMQKVLQSHSAFPRKSSSLNNVFAFAATSVENGGHHKMFNYDKGRSKRFFYDS